MIKTNPLSIANISKIAKNVRSEFKIGEGECFPILDYLNHLCDQGLLSMQIIDNDDSYLDQKTVALYNKSDNFIYIKEDVLKEYDEGNYRANFTLAHELFHYIQNQVLKFDFEEVEDRKTYEDPEWQANEFTGELLVPKTYLYLDEEELVKRFRVSMECVLTRKVQTKNRNERSLLKEKERSDNNG